MKEVDVFIEVEKILEKWDPIGVLQNFQKANYKEGQIGEYTAYVKPIIKAYIDKQSLVEFLVRLQTELADAPDNNMILEIHSVANELSFLFSNCDVASLKNI